MQNEHVFNLGYAWSILMEQIQIVFLWSQSHFIQFPAIGSHAPVVISFYNLFFSWWACVLIVGWIPIIGEQFSDYDDNSDNNDSYVWYD